jgi:hypothetical protein
MAAEKTTKKPKLSWMAKIIVDNYHRQTKGATAFLSEQMKWAMLASAMHSLMVNHVCGDEEQGLPARRYTDAYSEAMEYLWPEETTGA